MIADRINQLKAENVMLLNGLQCAQRLVAEQRYEEADHVLSELILKVLKLRPYVTDLLDEPESET